MPSYKYYLYDLGFEIKLMAQEARKKRDAAPEGSDEKQFYAGVVAGFFDVIYTMQQQAEGFDIPLSDLRLDDINPEKDLF